MIKDVDASEWTTNALDTLTCNTDLALANFTRWPFSFLQLKKMDELMKSIDPTFVIMLIRCQEHLFVRFAKDTSVFGEQIKK